MSGGMDMKRIRKSFRRLLLGVSAILVIGGGVVYLNLNRIVRRTIESQATNSLQLTTTLESARLSLLGGQLTLDDLSIASPKGFATPKMFIVDGATVAVRYGELRATPIRIQSISINNPTVVVERADGRFNFQAINLKSSDSEMKLVIDELTVHNANVILRPNISGLDDLKEIKVVLPKLTMKSIGTGDGAQNGAAIKDVVAQVMSAVASQAGDLAEQLPEQFRAALADQARAITGELRGKLNEKLGESLKGTGLDKQLDKALDQNLNKLLGYKSRK